MTTTGPESIAERLGLPEDVVRDLQRRGYLRRLDLDDDAIRARLWRAHCTRLPAARRPPPTLEAGASHRELSSLAQSPPS